jgi:ParB-like chromosome segregation protein Spo0J
MNDRRNNEPKQYKHNPLASCWPMLDEDQMAALVEDIKAHGLRNAIVLDQDDQILDGRNRNAACILAGVKPTFEVFIGGPEQQHAFVMSQNAQRRHMTSSQRAGVAGKMAAKLDEMKVANQQQAAADKAAAKTAGPKAEAETKSATDAKPEPQGRTRAVVAKALGISERSVQDGKKVAKQGTEELQNAVQTGVLPVHRAAKIADLPAEKQPEALKEAIEKRRETKSAKPAQTIPEMTDNADPSIALLSALLTHVSASQVVMMLARSLPEAKAKPFAKFLRETAETLDPPKREQDPAEGKAGKTPTAARLEVLIPGSFSAELRQAAIDWARHKQRMVKKQRIQSEEAWTKALKRMTKYPAPLVVEMIERAMSNNWVGWEHEPADIKTTKSAGVKIRPNREVRYDSIPS